MHSKIFNHLSFFGQEFSFEMKIDQHALSTLRSEQMKANTILADVHLMFSVNIPNNQKTLIMFDSLFPVEGKALRHTYIESFKAEVEDDSTESDEMKAYFEMLKIFNDWAIELNKISKDDLIELFREVEFDHAKLVDSLIETIEHRL